MSKRSISILLGLISVMAFAYIAGHYRLLPVYHLRTALEFIEEKIEGEEKHFPRPTESVDFMNSHLTRLLVKKIPLQNYDGSGGGLSESGNIMFISSNKGGLSVIDMNSYNRLSVSIDKLPMNYDKLVEAGQTERNSFREWWFRVNGIFSEQINESDFILYLSHNYYDDEKDCISHNVSTINLTIQDDNVIQKDGWVTLFSAEPCFDPEPEGFVSAVPYSGHISGGAIQLYDEDHLIISVGDYNHHGLGQMPNYAQDPNNPYGKFLLLNKQTGEWSVYAMGTRNPSGLFNDNSGTVWSVENGPEGGDELNIITESQNYGWPEVSTGIWYTPGYTFSDTVLTGRHSGYQTPVFSWLPSIAPSSIIRLEGNRFSLWQGDLLVGAMRGQAIHRLRLNSDNDVIYDERIEFGHRVRDIIELQKGYVAILTDDSYLIILDDGGLSKEEPDQFVADRILELEKFDRLISKESQINVNVSPSMVFEQKCATCHLLSKKSVIGPHLSGLLGREVGSATDYTYSEVLSRDQRVWDEDLLRTFLVDPQSEFSGNRMNKIELSDSEVNKLIRFFKSRETN